MKTIETKTTRVETRKRIELTEDSLRKLIKSATGEALPVGADIFVEVPGGGDWSNTSLYISKETPVIIAWTEVVEEYE